MSDTNAISSTSTRPPERSARQPRGIADSVQQHIKTAVHKELISGST